MLMLITSGSQRVKVQQLQRTCNFLFLYQIPESQRFSIVLFVVVLFLILYFFREDGVRSWMWVVNHQQTSRDEMHVEYYGKHLAGHGCGQQTPFDGQQEGRGGLSQVKDVGGNLMINGWQLKNSG